MANILDSFLNYINRQDRSLAVFQPGYWGLASTNQLYRWGPVTWWWWIDRSPCPRSRRTRATSIWISCSATGSPSRPLGWRYMDLSYFWIVVCEYWGRKSLIHNSLGWTRAYNPRIGQAHHQWQGLLKLRLRAINKFKTIPINTKLLESVISSSTYFFIP